MGRNSQRKPDIRSTNQETTSVEADALLAYFSEHSSRSCTETLAFSPHFYTPLLSMPRFLMCQEEGDTRFLQNREYSSERSIGYERINK
jgi:hypothetical protein